MFNKNEYCIIVPAYQSEKYLPILVEKIRTIVPDLTIYIINDGSKDKTSTCLLNEDNIILINHKNNLGKGRAILTGMNNAILNNFKYAIFIDADLQHDPEFLPKFLKRHEINNEDFIIGRRDFSLAKMPFHRILSNVITSFFISLRIGKRIHDSQCGFRLINLEKMKSINFRYHGFQFESEFIIKMCDRGFTFSEVPIPTIYNKSHSSINNYLDTLRFIVLFLRSFFWKFNSGDKK